MGHLLIIPLVTIVSLLVLVTTTTLVTILPSSPRIPSVINPLFRAPTRLDPIAAFRCRAAPPPHPNSASQVLSQTSTSPHLQLDQTTTVLVHALVQATSGLLPRQGPSNMASPDPPAPTGPIGMCGTPCHASAGDRSVVSDSHERPQLTWLYTGPDRKTTQAYSADGKKPAAAAASPTVRFAAVNEEIAPDESFQGLDSVSPSDNAPSSPGAQLKQISETLKATHLGTPLQERRMSHFNFEPVSLPASRVCPPFFLCCVIPGYRDAVPLVD